MRGAACKGGPYRDNHPWSSRVPGSRFGPGQVRCRPRSAAAALTSWPAAQSPQFRAQVEVVAMDGFGGYKTAATEILPDATAVMDPFHVVALAGPCLSAAAERLQIRSMRIRFSPTCV